MARSPIKASEAAFKKMLRELDPTAITPTEAEYLVERSLQIDRGNIVSANKLLSAGPELLGEAHWTTGTGKLHATRFASTTVARLTETHTEVTLDDEGKQRQTFYGFIHDVAHAELLMTISHALSEKEWSNFVGTKEYQALTFGQRNVERASRLRQWTNTMREHYANLAAAESLTRLEDQELQRISAAKRQRLSAPSLAA